MPKESVIVLENQGVLQRNNQESCLALVGAILVFVFDIPHLQDLQTRHQEHFHKICQVPICYS